MKKIFLLLTFVLFVQSLPAQMLENSWYAPLFLYTNGPGRIYPYFNSHILRVGYRYTMAAVPNRGYKFAGWQPVDVFTITQTNFSISGRPILPPMQSIIPSPMPISTYNPNLAFKMQGVILITTNGSNPNITRAYGWQANFVPWYQNVPGPQR
ncbi:MAG TPA: hypothetical protein VMH87_06385 [Pseudomonadales bacterium]|nr:hypothetical protein [Pseudomonadales bacterium]